MPFSPRPVLMASVCAALLAAAPARADDATPARAADMERQIRDAFATLLGPAVTISERPVEVTPAGGRYDLDFAPFKLLATAAPGTRDNPLRITGSATQAPGGVWRVEDINVTGVPMMDRLKARIVWDPSLATASSWTAAYPRSTLPMDGTDRGLTGTFGPAEARLTLTPANQGHVDLMIEAEARDFDLRGDASGGVASAALKRFAIKSGLRGVNTGNALRLTQAIVTLATPRRPGTQLDDLRAAADKTMLSALQDAAAAFDLDIAVDGLLVKGTGRDTDVEAFRLGFDTRTDAAGLLQAGLTLRLVRPDPVLPPDQLASLAPVRVDARYVAGGLALADLLSLLSLSAENRTPSDAEIQALFSHGGLTSGVETMMVVLGGTTFSGHLSVVATAPSPDGVAAAGQIVAENFDGLMQRVAAIPRIAREGMAALIFVKGFGKAVDGRLVWDIAFRDRRLMINDVDLTAMAGMPVPGAR